MRAVAQRVAQASVSVGGIAHGRCDRGLLALVGVAIGDDESDASRLAHRVARLRVFENEDGRFDRSLVDIGGGALVVSQFTLIADTTKGNRPSFVCAAPPEIAEPLYLHFCRALADEGIHVEMGVFGARMEVSLVNDGPMTIVLDTWTSPVIAYHGTYQLTAILRGGLLARPVLGCWIAHVCLSDLPEIAAWFAEGGDDPGIVEVDLTEIDFPAEGFDGHEMRIHDDISADRLSIYSEPVRPSMTRHSDPGHNPGRNHPTCLRIQLERPTVVCAECGRLVRGGVIVAERWRYRGTGNLLRYYCPECAECEFGLRPM